MRVTRSIGRAVDQLLEWSEEDSPAQGTKAYFEALQERLRELNALIDHYEF